jgi:hypothetical protein
LAARSFNVGAFVAGVNMNVDAAIARVGAAHARAIAIFTQTIAHSSHRDATQARVACHLLFGRYQSLQPAIDRGDRQ